MSDGSNQAYTYKWFLNGQPISGATGKTFTKANAQVADAGTYKVTVNAAGAQAPADSNNITVTVNAPAPTPTVTPVATAATAVSGTAKTIPVDQLFTFGGGSVVGDYNFAITPNYSGVTVATTGIVTVATAAAAGTAKVVATHKTASSVTATKDIVISPPAPTPTVTSVTVTGPAGAASPLAKLAPSATYQLSATVVGTNNPAQTVTWTVSPTANGTVSTAGLFTAAATGATGATTITATSTVDTSKKGTFEITSIA